MGVLRYLTAGESHGPLLTVIIEGLPAGVPLQAEKINLQLKRRQGGAGRGGRMSIEKDQAQFLSGVRGGLSIGSPITLQIKNRDWENWQKIMAADEGAALMERVVTHPRPGHADLPGAIKYRQRDIRNVLERSSARETAARVAAGAVAQEFLQAFHIRIQGQVCSIGSVKSKSMIRIRPENLYSTPLYCPSMKATEAMLKEIEDAKKNGDTMGGVIAVVADGLPIGLGSHVQADRRLDGRLAQALMSIQAIKGVEIGAGFEAAYLPGSRVHDEIFYDPQRGFCHRTNNAGGIEGGITNGEPLLIRAAMKPIPTLASPLSSVDILTKESFVAAYERSDVCAVPAAAIVAQAATAWELAVAVCEKFGGDHLIESLDNYRRYQEHIREF